MVTDSGRHQLASGWRCDLCVCGQEMPQITDLNTRATFHFGRDVRMHRLYRIRVFNRTFIGNKLIVALAFAFRRALGMVQLFLLFLFLITY